MWNEILSELRTEVSPESYETWLEPIQEVGLEGDGTLRLATPNDSVVLMLKVEYRQRILDAAARLALPVREIDAAVRSTPAPAAIANTRYGPAVQQTLDFKDRSASFNEKYSFQSFVVGSCNEFAHAAAQAVAANPARAYNPLYIYGGVGMGKTHLIHAIGQQLQSNFSGMRVVYVSSEQFMNEMIHSLRYDKMSSFHERFRTADALLIDDIQVLGSRERTQEEFFHTFNALHNLGKQIVISSDMPPKQVPGLVDRLKSRFAWGLMADIQAPDLETKMAIIDRKADEAGLVLPEDVRAMLATQLKSNIRELEGLLLRLTAISSMASRHVGDRVPINAAMAKQALRSIAGSADQASLASIMDAVAQEFDLQAEQLRQKSNTKAIAYPRQIAMYLCKNVLSMSLPEIGRAFGGKHHTTVLHSINKIVKLRRSDAKLDDLLHRLNDRFN
ncbi:MAG: chromosomal replication initiator protein DnaA [Bryobacterales bacterium]